MRQKEKLFFFPSNWTFEWLKTVGLVRTHNTVLSYVHNSNATQPCSHCAELYAVLYSFNAQRKNFVQSIFPISMPFTVLSVPHHCGRGASVWGRGGRWLWGGAECLTQTNAELLPLWFVSGTECNTDDSDHAHISANCWVVEPVFFGLNTEHIQLSWCTLSCTAYQCQWLPSSSSA